MVKVYTIASGKGGTGKTTLTANLGTMIAGYGKKVYIMDADIGMANLGLILGLENVPITLHEVLAGKAPVSEAIYEGPNGVNVVPSGISLKGFQDADPEKLREVLMELVDTCEYLLIDAPAGISRDAVIPLAIADEVILVVNPELSSMVDALKTKILTELIGGNIKGVILNKATLENTEISKQKMEEVLGVKVIGIIPDDPNVRKSAAYQSPVVIKYPNSDASVAIKKLAADLIGKEDYITAGTEEDEKSTKEGFLDRLARSLFRRKI